MTTEERKFIERCRELAIEASTTGNTPVGSIIVLDGSIIGEGKESTRQDNVVTRHAEIEAIRDALRRAGDQKLTGCILYTTHEPCILCSYAIRHYRISEIVFEKAVLALGGYSSSWLILTVDGVESWGRPPLVSVLQSNPDHYNNQN